MGSDFGIAVLISGRGSNLKSLVDKAQHYHVGVVLSDNPEAPGLEYARSHSIPALSFQRAEFESRKAQRKAIFDSLKGFGPKLICLAGFMQVVDAELVREHHGRLINIHPSLLPRFPGLHTHTQALEARATEHGCTVHFVDEGVDSGPIIAQASVPVSLEETADTLGARVLEREHRLYPWVVAQFAQGRLSLEGRHTKYAPELVQEAATLGFRVKEVY